MACEASVEVLSGMTYWRSLYVVLASVSIEFSRVLMSDCVCVRAGAESSSHARSECFQRMLRLSMMCSIYISFLSIGFQIGTNILPLAKLALFSVSVIGIVCGNN